MGSTCLSRLDISDEMYVCMDGWMDGCMYECMNVCMYVCMHACM